VPAGELAAAHITNPCHEVKTAKSPIRKVPIGGTAGSITWAARWGTAGRGDQPVHYLGVVVSKETGSGKALAIYEKNLRLEILGHGGLIPVRKGGLASVDTNTASCPNPPTDDCTRGDVLGIFGRFTVQISLADFPPTDPSAPASPGDDEPEDNAQEDAIKPALRSIAASVFARL
jgi:hypothetical protein